MSNQTFDELSLHDQLMYKQTGYLVPDEGVYEPSPMNDVDPLMYVQGFNTVKLERLLLPSSKFTAVVHRHWLIKYRTSAYGELIVENFPENFLITYDKKYLPDIIRLLEENGIAYTFVGYFKYLNIHKKQ